ncbi:hypothetical protein PENSPDRAFT_755311 [Peniophora sp. CONT]|nr:hypothetical protein PENSPDRAFT_755311 [Peniophora sp. CONT]
MAPSRRWGPLPSLLVLLPVLLGVPFFTYRIHYSLPTPLTALVNPETNLPQLSEAQILGYTRHLSEEIGFRTVGTVEHALADKYTHDVALKLKAECDEVARTSGRKLECEVWRQQGSGSHRFDMMGKRLYKTYRDLTNIVVRVSDGTDAGKADAVLVNAHLDSTLPSPGAADDALAVGVMLECIRVLTHTPDWEPKHAIIFLFNHAEESLQDGSQLYSTQHPTRSTVRAFLNLEAAGTTGPTLLFQANSEEMIGAYSKVPHPFGTVVANEVFSSGVLLSDTDFRQFELYLNVSGLDMAIVGDSYMYHTNKDRVEFIEAGVAQHMAENTLAILKYLSSEESPLPQLVAGFHKPTTVFFSIVHMFFLYSAQTAQMMYATLLVCAVAFTYATYRDPSARRGTTGISVWAAHRQGIFLLTVGLLGSLLSVNAHAIIMHRYLGKNMSWFATELSPLLLYGPSALAGALASQALFDGVHERTMFTSLLILMSFGAVALQLIGIGSAAILFTTGLPLFAALLLDKVINTSASTVSLITYVLGQIVPLMTGTEVILTTFDVFVPLTGRIGAEAPAEHIIATIAAVSLAYTVPLVLPFAHRYSGNFILYTIIGLHAVLFITSMVFAQRSPFDELHQRRLFVLSSDNITTGERSLHIGAADGAPGFDDLAVDIGSAFGAAGGVAILEEMNDYNGDWDVLYPFSAFMSPYQISLPHISGYSSPFRAGGEQEFRVHAVNDRVDTVAGTRSFTLQIDHPGVIWTVVAFDAQVLSWSLESPPPEEYARHHIKEASFHGVDTWSVDIVVAFPPNTTPAPIPVNFVGLQESAMWPGKQKVKELGGPPMVLFEMLDNWLDDHLGDTVDAMMLSSIGGIVSV